MKGSYRPGVRCRYTCGMERACAGHAGAPGDGPHWSGWARVLSFAAMARTPGRRRAKALVLLIVLLVGGFGLPIVDGLWFHSKAIAQMAAESRVGDNHDSGRAHLFGCAIWSSPAASTGHPAVGSTPNLVLVAVVVPTPSAVPVFRSQSVPTLALPRAPPSV